MVRTRTSLLAADSPAVSPQESPTVANADVVSINTWINDASGSSIHSRNVETSTTDKPIKKIISALSRTS